jgi:hypothetical protein
LPASANKTDFVLVVPMSTPKYRDDNCILKTPLIKSLKNIS